MKSITDSYDEAPSSIVEAYQEMGILKPMTLAERTAAPTPTQVSNRTIYDRCLAWGCKVTKTNGNWIWMMSPIQYRFKIRPPQQHEANGKFEIEAMLGALAVPWAIFIAAEILNIDDLKKAGEGFKKSGGPEEHPTDPMGPCSVCEEDVQRVHLVKRGKKIAHSYCLNKPVEAQPDETAPPIEEETAVTEPDPVPAQIEVQQVPAEVDESSPSRLRYINDVFDLLVERGDALSNKTVAQALGLTPSQATSALGALAAQGVLRRIKSGVYQAMPDVRRKSGTLGLVVSNEGEQQPAQPQTRGTVTFAGVESLHLEANATEDETLNELLDLMAPNGFKARHLPLIDAFKDCALALMREVNQ